MQVKTEKDGDTGVIILKGDITLQNIGTLKEIVIPVLDGNALLMINIEEVEDFDLSAVQFFCSLHRTVVKQNKKVTITGTIPKSFNEIISGCGIEKTQCMIMPKEQCLFHVKTG